MATTINAGTATSGAAISADTSGILQLQSGSTPTTAITVDTAQNVGIGTTSPTNRLGVVGGIQITQGSSAFPTSGSGLEFIGGIVGGTNYIQAYNRTGSTWQNLLIGSGLTTFETAGSERMRIDSSGNLLVNKTSATAGDGKLQLQGAASATAMTVQVGTDGNAGINFRNSAAGNPGYIVVNTSTVVYSSVSDYRLKENVAPMQNALNVVQQLKPVTYSWKSDGAASQGFIAHELQEVFPDAVTGEKDAVDENGKPVYQGIDTSFLVATLVAAIQELKAEVDALKGVK